LRAGKLSSPLRSVLLLCALLIGTTTSAAEVITFEEIAAAGPGEGSGTPVLNFYAARGVIFKAVALDYSKGIAIPNFAHSGTKAIETCIAVEFCTAPIEASFTQAQAHIKIRAGFSAVLMQPITVVLRAFANDGSQVGQATANLAANPLPTSIQTPLEVNTATATIVRVTIDIEDGGVASFTNGLAIDDLEFDTAGPPPACTATQNPTLDVSQPANNLLTQFNQFPLAFAVNTSDPFAVTTVTATVGGQSRTVTYAGLNGAFGPTAMTEFLFPGIDTVTIAVRDCFGTAHATVTVVFAPIAADERFHVMGFEATQVVQNVPSSVPLIANKPTLVRVYLQASGSTSTVVNVRGTLFAYRPLNDELTRGPQLIDIVHSSNVIDVDKSTDIRPRRLTLAKSLNFELPADWITPGAVNFVMKFDIDGSLSSPVNIPCDGCDNVFPNRTPVFTHFIAMPVLRVRIVGMQYELGSPPVLQPPRPQDFALLQSWIQRAYPAGDFDFSTTMVTSNNAWPFDCDTANTQLSALRATEVAAGQDSHTHYIALVINNGGFMRGCASGVPDSPDTSVVASSPTGDATPGAPNRPINVPGDTDGSFGDWYGGHELAHEFGRAHPGFCNNNSSDDDNFPNPNGQISDNLQTFVGLDKGDAFNVIPQTVISPFAFDIMTYCNQPQWFSAYNYLAVLQRFRAENNLTGLSQAMSSSNVAAPAHRPNETMTGHYVSIVASVNLTRHAGRIRYVNHVRQATVAAIQPNQIVTVQLRDKAGKVIQSVPSWVRVDSDLPAGRDQIGVVQVIVADDPAAARVELLVHGKLLDARAITAHAPVVKELRLTKEKLPCGPGKQPVLRWVGLDADGDALTYLVQISGANASWDTIAVGLKQPRLILTSQQLQSAPQRHLRVIANDGYNESVPVTLK